MSFALRVGWILTCNPRPLEWLDERGRFASEQNRSGFTPGEGAGFCLMAAEETAQKYRLPILGRVTGVGIAGEENGVDSEDPEGWIGDEFRNCRGLPIT